MKGAGGTPGGILQFLAGLIMMCGGFYLLFNSILVNARFGFGYRVFSAGGYGITSGMIMIPFLFGVAMIFYNSKSFLGWVLSVGSLACLLFGVLASVNFSMRTMPAFDLIVMLVLAFGGLGLLFKSFQADATKA